MKKILLLSVLVTLSVLHVAQADDSVRSAQTVLQSSGYYTGQVNGELNADTKAALRRYQIRNQLEPSGELTAETVAALNKEGRSAPAEAPAPQPAPTDPPVPPATQAPQAVPGIAMDNPEYARVFTRTPYENAPPEVQVQTVRAAQMMLAKRGVFQGIPDGRVGPDTEEALFRFQASRELPRTGRLDIDTLAELHLLPVSKLQRPRGIQVPPELEAPRGAVRGVPLD